METPKRPVIISISNSSSSETLGSFNSTPPTREQPQPIHNERHTTIRDSFFTTLTQTSNAKKQRIFFSSPHSNKSSFINMMRQIQSRRHYYQLLLCRNLQQRRSKVLIIVSVLLFVVLLLLLPSFRLQKSLDASTKGVNQNNELNFLLGASGSSNSISSNNNIAPLDLINNRINDIDLERLNSYLFTSTPEYILQWAHTNFHPLIQMTSFGPTGIVILHKLKTAHLLDTIPIVTLDTLHLFPETYSLIQQLKEDDAQYPTMDLRVYKPLDISTRQQFDERYGSEIWKESPDKYAYLSKVEPMIRALDELNVKATITGRRRSQGGERSTLNVIERDNTNPDMRYKINPLVMWTYKDVWDYIHEHHLLYNTLHDRGYKSVGDEMTTVPVGSGAEERSGRFVGLMKGGGTKRVECGIHAHLEKIQKMKKDAESQGRVFEMPRLECADCLDVNVATFDRMVLNGDRDMLLEFYSPLCGGCQEFGPKLAAIASKLAPLKEKIEVARFDITENEVPQSGQSVGLNVEVTPTLFLIQRQPTLRVVLFTEGHQEEYVWKWLEEMTEYVNSPEMMKRPNT